MKDKLLPLPEAVNNEPVDLDTFNHLLELWAEAVDAGYTGDLRVQFSNAYRNESPEICEYALWDRARAGWHYGSVRIAHILAYHKELDKELTCQGLHAKLDEAEATVEQLSKELKEACTL